MTPPLITDCADTAGQRLCSLLNQIVRQHSHYSWQTIVALIAAASATKAIGLEAASPDHPPQINMLFSEENGSQSLAAFALPPEVSDQEVHDLIRQVYLAVWPDEVQPRNPDFQTYTVQNGSLLTE